MSSLTEGRIGDERGFIHTRQVTWGDCDPAQIAYTGRIPNFGLEAIDAWWLHHTGFDWFRFQVERDFGTPFVHLDVDFRSPITPRHPLRSEVRLMHVGTTSLRLLESAALETGEIQPFRGDTAIFITPGYRFKAIDVLMTNFHLPKSTLFMLVSAFSGLETMQHAYKHAIETGYRFYSYGDASLLFPTAESARA